MAYAASLVAAMEGPIAQTLLREQGLHLSGEAKGSKALTHLVAAGLRTPDVLITADPALLRDLVRTSEHAVIDRYIVFGSARMLIGYAATSKYAPLFQRAARGRRSILSVLAAPGVRIGRTDPALDPKGARTVRCLALLGQAAHDGALAQRVLRDSAIFPEEDLAVRVESGELDAGFFYSTELPRSGMRSVELPAPANLAKEIAYAVAILRHAQHPAAARAFVDFILHGDGRRILERAGLRFFQLKLLGLMLLHASTGSA